MIPSTQGRSLPAFPPEMPAPPSTVHGSWTYYALFDQVIYEPNGRDDPRNLGVFASVVVSPDQSINQMPFFCDGGFIFRDLIPGLRY